MATEQEPGTAKADRVSEPVQPDVVPKASPVPNRKIPGNLPYLSASGTFEKVLDKIIEAARPPKFNSDFLENVLKLTGGAARATIPILKRMEFVSSDGTPTDLYARFRTESGRGAAALHGLRAAFPEIFKRSDYAHAVDDGKLKDIIVEITGLTPGDAIVRAIRGTFNAIKNYVPEGTTLSSSDEPEVTATDEPTAGLAAQQPSHVNAPQTRGKGVGLVYNINIVIPETSDVRVLNAIFRAVKDNLLQ